MQHTPVGTAILVLGSWLGSGDNVSIGERREPYPNPKWNLNLFECLLCLSLSSLIKRKRENLSSLMKTCISSKMYSWMNRTSSTKEDHMRTLWNVHIIIL